MARLSPRRAHRVRRRLALLAVSYRFEVGIQIAYLPIDYVDFGFQAMKRTQLNALIDAAAMVAFMLLASTGFVLQHQLPPGSGELAGRGVGRGAMQRSVELLWGATRHEWGTVHYWIAWALVLILSVHLLLHRKWIVCTVKGTKSEASGWRFALGLFSFLVVTVLLSLPLVSSTTTTTRRELLQQRTNTAEPEQGTPPAAEPPERPQ
jgi:hypothetical protein